MSSSLEYGYNLFSLASIFRQHLSSGIISQRKRSYSPITVKNYLSDLTHFISWLSFQYQTTCSTTEHLTQESIQKYKFFMKKSCLPRRSVNRRLSSVRVFCKFLALEGIMPSNPAKRVSNLSTAARSSVRLKNNPEQISTRSRMQRVCQKQSTANDLRREYIHKHTEDIDEFLKFISARNTSHES
ncbi:MAG: site-specific integrase [Candidatus Paceibacterota bacterium]